LTFYKLLEIERRESHPPPLLWLPSVDTHHAPTSMAGQPLLTSPFHSLFAGLFLLTRADEPGVAHIAPIPARERPVMNDDLELLKLVVADLA
jgi:hypothetical protein